MADRPSSDASSNSSLAVYETPAAHIDHQNFNDAMQHNFMPGAAFTDVELTTHWSGDATPRANNNNNNTNNDGAPVPQFPQFDPRALLNPKSSTSKRPASAGSDAERGRTDPNLAGQVSLVERLHNVQDRTASPAKRVKTDEDRKKTSNGSSFGGSSALGLQRTNGQAPVQAGPAIDLTMSECPEI
jgi:hypothetical protein